MKVRLTGTRDECTVALDALSAVLDVREVSAFHPNRGASVLGRVYLDAEPHARPARSTACADQPAARPSSIRTALDGPPFDEPGAGP